MRFLGRFRRSKKDHLHEIDAEDLRLSIIIIASLHSSTLKRINSFGCHLPIVETILAFLDTNPYFNDDDIKKYMIRVLNYERYLFSRGVINILNTDYIERLHTRLKVWKKNQEKGKDTGPFYLNRDVEQLEMFLQSMDNTMEFIVHYDTLFTTVTQKAMDEVTKYSEAMERMLGQHPEEAEIINSCKVIVTVSALYLNEPYGQIFNDIDSEILVKARLAIRNTMNAIQEILLQKE